MIESSVTALSTWCRPCSWRFGSSISLVVSSIHESAVITYISVLERNEGDRHPGAAHPGARASTTSRARRLQCGKTVDSRALVARCDVGIAITLLLTIPANAIVEAYFGCPTGRLVRLPVHYAAPAHSHQRAAAHLPLARLHPGPRSLRAATPWRRLRSE